MSQASASWARLFGIAGCVGCGCGGGYSQVFQTSGW